MAAPIVVLAWAARIAVGVVARVGRGVGRAAGATLAKAWKDQAKRITAGALATGDRVLNAAAEDLRKRAKALSPEDTGALMLSGEVTDISHVGLARYAVTFGASGPSTRYAVRMHDGFYNLGPITAQKKSADGQAGRKFLERPYNMHKNRYMELLAKGIRIGIGRSA